MDYDYELIPDIISEQIIVDLIGQISFDPPQYETATTSNGKRKSIQDGNETAELSKKRRSSMNLPKRFKCPYCTANYSKKDNLKKHVKQHHAENYETTDFTKTLYFVDQTVKQNASLNVSASSFNYQNI